MPRVDLAAPDGNTLTFSTTLALQNARVMVDGVEQHSSFYTYAGTTLTYLPAAFPSSPTPGAPPAGSNHWIEGDLSVLTTSSVTTSRDYSTTEMIASIQQRAFIPLASRDFGSAQILRLLNEEIDGYLVPFVAQRRLEFWVESQDIAVSGGNGQYLIPSVAMGGKFRALAYMVGPTPFLLDYIDLPMAVATTQLPLTLQYPSRYYFQGNTVVVWPTPSGTGTLRVYYYRRPSTLVLPSQCVQVTGFPGGAPAGYFRLGIAGQLPGAYAVNTPVDLVSAIPNFTLYANTLLIHATDGSTYVELPGTLPTGLAVGDWICLYNTAPVMVGAPADLWNLIVQEVALKVAEAKGTNETVQRLAAGLAKAENMAGWTIQQRNDGAMRKVSAFPADSLAWPYPWGGQ